MYELKIIRERREGYGARKQFRHAHDIYETFHNRFERADREEFIVLLLDAKNKLLGFHVVSVGSLTASVVHPREVFKVAILGNAVALILVHNHPSGDPLPSAEDVAITTRLCQIGEVLGIKILDHVVIGEGRYVSFVEDGYLQGQITGAQQVSPRP
ncbi:MAG: JAB domain-containing protein [Deltaproteobacteria bacterium]|nr:JAB domain-containing protein [Deltaproteobacteria bacterium]